MVKYSEYFKLNSAKEYINGLVGYTSLAKKYGIPDTRPIYKCQDKYAHFRLLKNVQLCSIGIDIPGN